MDHKEDIGKLIKDRMTNSEVEPNDALWASIESTLDKRQRKSGFIWFWSGALLLVGIFVLLYFIKIDKTIDTENLPKTSVTTTTKDGLQKKQLKENNKLSIDTLNDKSSEKEVIILSNEITNINANKTITENENIQEEPSTNKQNRNLKNLVKNRKIYNRKGELVNETFTSEKNRNTPSENLKPSGTNDKLDDQTSSSLTYVENIIKTDSILKKSIAASDSIPKKNKRALKEDEEVIERKKDIDNKWLISIQVAPTMWGFFDNSTPFDRSLSGGQLRSNVSISYAALFNIPLNEKLSFRMGFRYTNLKFNIVQAQSPIATNGQPAIFTDNALFRNNTLVSTGFIESLNPPNEFRIQQDVSYQEIPMQFTYQIYDEKLQIDAIAGLSGMFLKRNDVTIDNDSNSISIGSADYLKKFTVGSMIGIGFRYQLSERVRLDLEPTFQYQLGAFDKDFENLHPFIFNLNVGTTLKL